MPPTWILLSLASAMALGAYDVAKKLAVDRAEPLSVLLQGSIGSLLMLLPLWFASPLGWLPSDSTFVVRPLSSTEHGLVLFKAVIVSTSWVCSYFAIRRLPISLAVPLRASAPLFTVLGAIVIFGERLELNHWLAIALIFAGYFGLARVGRKEGIEFRKDPAILLLVLATLLGAGSGLFDKFLLSQRAIAPTTLQFWFSFYNVMFQAMVVLAFVLGRRLSFRRLVEPSWLSFLVGALLVLADQFYFRALSQEGALIAVVSMTRRSNVIMSFVIGGLILREPRLAQKGKMLAIVLLGVLLLFL